MTYPSTPTDWNEGIAPGISAAQLNRIEQSILDGQVDEIEGETSVSLAVLAASYAPVAIVSLEIPADWVSYSMTMTCSFTATGDSSPSKLDYYVAQRDDLGGELGLSQTIYEATISDTSGRYPFSIVGHRYGITDVNQFISGRMYARETVGQVAIYDLTAYARVRRGT